MNLLKPFQLLTKILNRTLRAFITGLNNGLKAFEHIYHELIKLSYLFCVLIFFLFPFVAVFMIGFLENSPRIEILGGVLILIFFIIILSGFTETGDMQESFNEDEIIKIPSAFFWFFGLINATIGLYIIFQYYLEINIFGEVYQKVKVYIGNPRDSEVPALPPSVNI